MLLPGDMLRDMRLQPEHVRVDVRPPAPERVAAAALRVACSGGGSACSRSSPQELTRIDSTRRALRCGKSMRRGRDRPALDSVIAQGRGASGWGGMRRAFVDERSGMRCGVAERTRGRPSLPSRERADTVQYYEMHRQYVRLSQWAPHQDANPTRLNAGGKSIWYVERAKSWFSTWRWKCFS